MESNMAIRPHLDRRRWLKLAFAFPATSILSRAVLNAQSEQQSCAPEIPQHHKPSNGGNCPFPIPWLDKNGSHNQPAGPDLEPSHIYHFKGRVARCPGFSGIGTDGKNERLLFGTKTTDYDIMDGEYWAARAAQTGTFTHI